MNAPLSSSNLAERVAVVTGAASGIGVRYATHLVACGARVTLSDVTEPGPQARELLEANPQTRFVQADVADPNDASRLIGETLAAFGRVDVLLNNAALFTTLKKRPLEELTTEEWNRVLSVNVLGVFHCVQAATPAMKAQKSGKIINIASNVAHKGLPLLLHYVASKGAVIAMTRAMARELGPSGIQVNAIAPGFVLHEATQAADPGRNEQVIKLRALGRTLTPDDLLGAVEFLASPASDFMTGQTLVIDGGEVFP